MSEHSLLFRPNSGQTNSVEPALPMARGLCSSKTFGHSMRQKVLSLTETSSSRLLSSPRIASFLRCLPMSVPNRGNLLNTHNLISLKTFQPTSPPPHPSDAYTSLLPTSSSRIGICVYDPPAPSRSRRPSVILVSERSESSPRSPVKAYQ